jgi:hypothetical protein
MNSLNPSHPGFVSGFWANWNCAWATGWAGFVSLAVLPSPPAISVFGRLSICIIFSEATGRLD